MFSFHPTEEQQLIVDTVRDFAREQLRPHSHEANESRTLPADVLASARTLGLIPANIPEAYGGFGEKHSAILGVLYAEELAYGDLSSTLHLLAPASVATPLLKFGTEEQKQRYLPRFADEKFFASAALIESKWNFDPSALNTTAQRTENGYVLNGRKNFVTAKENGAAPDLLFVYAKDESSGTTQAFLVESSQEGVAVGERERNMGLWALPAYTLTFDEVEVPLAAKLGGAEGSKVQELLAYARVGAAAVATGVARAGYEYAQEYAKQREAFGKPVAQFQAIAFMLAEMRIAVESMRLLTWEAAWKLDESHSDAGQAAVLAKQYADEYALQVADRAVQVLGGHGYIREYPVERWLREARLFGAVEGIVMI
jgi:acyl-CoA dehydrogenase